MTDRPKPPARQSTTPPMNPPTPLPLQSSLSPTMAAWTRRRWLASQVLALGTIVGQPLMAQRGPRAGRRGVHRAAKPATARAAQAARLAAQAERLDPAPWQALAQQAVDAARSAGATYADARLSRIVQHHLDFQDDGENDHFSHFEEDTELVGLGVRALVNGYWGFSASTVLTADEAVRLARDAVGQAKENAKGPPRAVTLSPVLVAHGSWTTPIQIDPFTIPIEEKLDLIEEWKQTCYGWGVDLVEYGTPSWLTFVRDERVVATSEGALLTQTRYESGGVLLLGLYENMPGGGRVLLAQVDVPELTVAGAGWERVLDAKVPERIRSGEFQAALRRGVISQKTFTVGRYTLVCDGATMAALVESTLGVATQLDRALGYEANASGTSFLEDPLGMVGNYHLASPLVTVTANRSTPGELATVQWDDEGVEPQPFTLVQHGVVTDFQTTREQAAWLAPYYQKIGQPVHSHGCAATEDAHFAPMQHLPNLSLEPNPAAVRVEDLVADVKDGLLVEGGEVFEMDSQARTGLLLGRMREIKNGRLGPKLAGGAVLFETEDAWKHLQALGGVTTQARLGRSQYGWHTNIPVSEYQHHAYGKGTPPQVTSHSVRAVAATIPNQPLINPARKA